MNELEHAIGMLDRAGELLDRQEDMDPSTSAIVAIAAGVIALVERKPQFVQVGDVCMRIDQIVEVAHYTDSGTLHIITRRSPTVQLEDPHSIAAFLAWWGENVDVTRLDVEGVE